MRYNYYYQKKGDQKHAMELYSKLNSSRLDLCQSCPGYCENTCPYGVAAKGLLAVARENLEFTSPAKDSFINYT
jgi:ferredoxin